MPWRPAKVYRADEDDGVGIDDALTLDAGTYRFQIATVVINGPSGPSGPVFSGGGSHDIAIRIVPSPSTASALALFGILGARRRR